MVLSGTTSNLRVVRKSNSCISLHTAWPPLCCQWSLLASSEAQELQLFFSCHFCRGQPHWWHQHCKVVVTHSAAMLLELACPHPSPLPAAFSISRQAPSLLPAWVFVQICAEPGQGSHPSQKNSLLIYFLFSSWKKLFCLVYWVAAQALWLAQVHGGGNKQLCRACSSQVNVADPQNLHSQLAWVDLTMAITCLFFVMPQMLPTLLSRNVALAPSVSCMHIPERLSNQSTSIGTAKSWTSPICLYQNRLEESFGGCWVLPLLPQKLGYIFYALIFGPLQWCILIS